MVLGGIFLCIFGLAVVVLVLCGFGLRSGCGFEFGWAFGLLCFRCCFGFMVFVGLGSWLGVVFSGFCFWLLAISLVWAALVTVFVLLVCLTCALWVW